MGFRTRSPSAGVVMIQVVNGLSTPITIHARGLRGGALWLNGLPSDGEEIQAGSDITFKTGSPPFPPDSIDGMLALNVGELYWHQGPFGGAIGSGALAFIPEGPYTMQKEINVARHGYTAWTVTIRKKSGAEE